MNRSLAALAVIFLCTLHLAAAPSNKKDIPAAPLPAAITNAKKIFVSNGGGSNLAYDAFYSKMKDWGKYQIVGSPDEADLIVELAYRVVDEGPRVWSTTNTYNNTTHVHSEEITDPQVVLTIYDAKTKTSLWSEIDHRRAAGRQKNKDKETINSAERLVADLKHRTVAQ
jgi:hypothetical protein